MHTGETLRCDADDGEVETTEADLPPDDSRIGSELLGPRVVREHDDRIATRHSILVGTQGTTERWSEFEHIEKVSAHGEPELALHHLVVPRREARERDGVRRQAGEALCTVSQIDVVEIREPVVAEEDRLVRPRRRGAHADDLIGARDGQRSQDEAVGQAEHGRVGADADRDRHDRDQREARVLHEHPRAMAEVLEYAFDHC